MRRKDREMDREFGLGIIDKARYGVLSMLDEENGPYGVPLSLVREGGTLYFHSAKEGKKVSGLAKNPRVSAAFVGDTKIPENYTNEELDEILQDESQAALLTSKVFTTEFESAIVTGTARLVADEEEKLRALRLICQKYTPAKMAYFDLAAKAGINRAVVYAIEIEGITAKRKKYGPDGAELKREQ